MFFDVFWRFRIAFSQKSHRPIQVDDDKDNGNDDDYDDDDNDTAAEFDLNHCRSRRGTVAEFF